MYQQLLSTLKDSSADETILAHIKPLARLTNARIHLVHVADGWVARNFDQLNLAESEEMREDWKYLEETAGSVRAEHGLIVTTRLALGNPPNEILKVGQEEEVDLIAMASHGHRLVGDII